MSKEFVPCEHYPLCTHHKCDCYETYCMTSALDKMTEEKKRKKKRVPKIKSIEDLKKIIK